MINRQIEFLKKHNKNIKVVNKEDSKFMKFLSVLLFFNKDFMTKYITTIGDTIYFPKSLMSKLPKSEIASVIAHEFVHIDDSHKDKLFKWKYLFPASAAPLFLLLMPFYFWIGLALFVLCLLPLPAFWRKKYELRAYKMTLASYHAYRNGNVDDKEWDLHVNFINAQFTTSAYYFMWPFGVKKELYDFVNKLKSNDILSQDSVYQIGYNAVKNSK